MDKLKFEDSLIKLQEACEKMKSGNITLEEAIACYNEGKEHYRNCKSILDEATSSIEIIERDEQK